MAAFEPAGERARWRILYDLLRKCEVGDVLTYAEATKALGLGSGKTARHTVQLAVRRADRELMEVDRHTIEAVPNVGYRVVAPAEQMVLAKKEQRKAGRSLARGQAKATHVDFNQLDDESRKAFEVVAQAFAAQIDFNRRMDVRQRNLEKAVQAVTQRSAEVEGRTAEELEELRARLARLEERTPEAS